MGWFGRMVFGSFTQFHCLFGLCLLPFSRFLRMTFLPLKYIFGLKIVVKGKENLRTKKPFVLVLNHQTSLDIMGMW